MTGDPTMDMWAGGITEDLIDRLSRCAGIPVIAMASTGDAGVSQLTSSAVGALVGANYVVRGQLMTGDDALNLQVFLFDAKRSQLLWSGAAPAGSGVTQPALVSLTQDIVANLDAYVDTAEQALVINRAVDELDIDEMVWRARWHLGRLTREDAAIADELLSRSLQAKPNSAGSAHPVGARQGVVDLVEARAAGRDRNHAGVRVACGRRRQLRCARLSAHRHGGDVAAQPCPCPEPVRRRDPAQPEPRFGVCAVGQQPLPGRVSGSGICAFGEGVAPKPTGWAGILYPRGDRDVHFMLGAHERALEFTELSLARRPAYSFAHVIRINCLIAGDRKPEARRALADLSRVRARFVATELDWLPFPTDTGSRVSSAASTQPVNLSRNVEQRRIGGCRMFKLKYFDTIIAQQQADRAMAPAPLPLFDFQSLALRARVGQRLSRFRVPPGDGQRSSRC